MFIEDGTGSGRKAEVDADNHLVTSAFTAPVLARLNEELGQVFALPLDAVAPSGATVFFIIQNNGQSTYALYQLLLASSAAGVFRVTKVSGTPAGGTALTSYSQNMGKTTVLEIGRAHV